MNIAHTCNICLSCLKINNAYNKLHDPEWVKNASRRATPSRSIIHNYVSAFTTNKPDPTPCTVMYIHSVWLQFSVMPRTVHIFARSKLSRQNMMNDVRLFFRVLVLGNSMRIDKRQSIQLCPPRTG